MSYLTGKAVLITGGTGSFGQCFVREALTLDPSVIRIYSRGELAQVDMEREFHDERLRFFIGDVRDKDRLYRAMNGVDVVVHAAALKQVPVCEYNPIEAVKTNILGSVNVIECAIDNRVEKVITISTDKSVAALNLYGCTKAVAERLFVQANSYTGGKPPFFSAVRYGNVANSRGSLITLLDKQADKVELTDVRMTRFWITLKQGAHFVLFCLEQMVGGEVFIPKLPSVRVVDLLSVISPNAKINHVGVRPGEKFSEILVSSDEVRLLREFDSYYVLEPAFSFWRKETLIGGVPVSESFSYSSDQNPLPKEQVERLVSLALK